MSGWRGGVAGQKAFRPPRLPRGSRPAPRPHRGARPPRASVPPPAQWQDQGVSTSARGCAPRASTYMYRAACPVGADCRLQGGQNSSCRGTMPAAAPFPCNQKPIIYRRLCKLPRYHMLLYTAPAQLRCLSNCARSRPAPIKTLHRPPQRRRTAAAAAPPPLQPAAAAAAASCCRPPAAAAAAAASRTRPAAAAAPQTARALPPRPTPAATWSARAPAQTAPAVCGSAQLGF